MGIRVLAGGLAKFVAVVVGGLALGAGIGLGLAELSGGGGGDEAPAAAAPAATASGPTAEVLSAELMEASTFSGRARDRARISVRVRLSNGSDAALTIDRPELVVDAGSTPADPAADDFAGPLLEEIAPGADATGLLRFETAGDVTNEIAEAGGGDLEIAGETVPVTLDE